jgi:hypothetical protein
MEPALYEADFGPASQQEFRELLQQAGRILVLPPARGARAEEIGRKGQARNVQYALAGAVVARHSHVLLALWDGLKEEGLGGTAQIVLFRRSGRFAARDLQEALETLEQPLGLETNPPGSPEERLVVQIVTPRRSAPAPERPFDVVQLC